MCFLCEQVRVMMLALRSCTINALLLNLLHPSLRVMTSWNACGRPHKNLRIACDDEMCSSCWFAVYFTHSWKEESWPKVLAKILCFRRCTTSGLILKIFLRFYDFVRNKRVSIYSVDLCWISAFEPHLDWWRSIFALPVLQVNHSLWVLGVSLAHLHFEVQPTQISSKTNFFDDLGAIWWLCAFSSMMQHHVTREKW